MTAVDIEVKARQLERLEALASDLCSRRDFLTERRDDLEEEMEDLNREIAVLKRVSELFKFLIDRLVYEYASSFSEIVSEGLQTIFTDQDLSFSIDVDQKWGKVALDFVTRHGKLEGDALDSFGGGVTSVQSLILRILVLLKSGLARYLFLDESLAALSEEYVPQCGQFLSRMCEDMGVDVLLITHNRSFLEWADNSYEAELGDDGLELEKIR